MKHFEQLELSEKSEEKSINLNKKIKLNVAIIDTKFRIDPRLLINQVFLEFGITCVT